jgi:hypothetical protein
MHDSPNSVMPVSPGCVIAALTARGKEQPR